MGGRAGEEEAEKVRDIFKYIGENQLVLQRFLYECGLGDEAVKNLVSLESESF